MNTADYSSSAPVDKNEDKSSQPSLMNIKSIPVSTAMQVESEVLEPLTFSQSECVFELAPKGFLHAGSCLSVGFSNTGNLNNAFPYTNIGVQSIVRRAVLRTTAGRVICDTEDWNYLQGCKSLFITNSHNKEREQFLSGRQTNFELLLDDSNFQKSSGYGLGNNLEYDYHGGTHNTKGKNVESHLKHSSNSEFQIKLHELFPYMKAGNQIPLFLIPNERIQVQIFWADTAGRFALNKTDADAGRATENLNIDQTRTKLISDHIFYDGETMARFEESNKGGLTFEYIDYRLSKQSLLNHSASGAGDDSDADNFSAKYDTQNNIRNIGGNGMVVNKIFFSYEDPNKDAKSLLGKFGAVGMSASGSSVSELTTNLFVNNEYLYPQAVKNPARQFHNLKETGGMIPFITRQGYSGEGSGGLTNTAAGYIEGHSPQAQFSGRFFWNGFLLSGLNKRIDNRGIDLHTSGILGDLKAQPIRSYTQRAWLEVRRYVVIKDGHLECYFM